MSEQLDAIGVTDELTKKRGEGGSIEPERDLQDKSVPYSKLKLKESILYTDLDPESPIPWSYISMQGGWVGVTDTWTYASADSPTFTVTVPSGATTLYSPGMRVRLTQTTTKYFLITAVADTVITLYGGTDYTLTSATISDISFSYFKAPIGFPLNPTKWTVIKKDSNVRSQSSATDSTWYNVGTTNCQITIPIGVWDVDYRVFASWTVTGVGAGDVGNNLYTTLSTANNSESDKEFTAGSSQIAYTALGTAQWNDTFFVRKTLALTTKTLYYLNSQHTGGGTPTISFENGAVDMIIRAVSAYL